MTQFLRSPVTWLVAIFIGIAAGGGYWYVDRQQKRALAEQQRFAEEQAELKRAAELEARRVKEQQRFQDEMQAQRDAEEKARQIDADFRKDELGRKRFTADDSRPQDGYAARVAERIGLEDDYRRRQAESQQQYEERSALQRARAEVERQKRYLDQREVDEQAARVTRQQAAQESSSPSAMPPPVPDEASQPVYRKPVKSR